MHAFLTQHLFSHHLTATGLRRPPSMAATAAGKQGGQDAGSGALDRRMGGRRSHPRDVGRLGLVVCVEPFTPCRVAITCIPLSHRKTTSAAPRTRKHRKPSCGPPPCSWPWWRSRRARPRLQSARTSRRRRRRCRRVLCVWEGQRACAQGLCRGERRPLHVAARPALFSPRVPSPFFARMAVQRSGHACPVACVGGRHARRACRECFLFRARGCSARVRSPP
jgi:hypothetical protein